MPRRGGRGSIASVAVARPVQEYEEASHAHAPGGQVTYHNGENIPVVLFLNKLDQGGKLAKDDLDAFCAAHGFVAWFPCSAKARASAVEPGVVSIE